LQSSARRLGERNARRCIARRNCGFRFTGVTASDVPLLEVGRGACISRSANFSRHRENRSTDGLRQSRQKSVNRFGAKAV
jgi:hypothetical protein